jgi:thioredoxin-related protein
MKILFIALLGLAAFAPGDWQNDFEKAKQTAQADHKYILLNFSGSDWCGPCIRLHKEIFDADVFDQYAKSHLVLVNADFPRLKKHALPAALQKKNDELADQYNKEGTFPLTILLTSEGKVLKTWEGLPPVSAEEFTKQVQSIVDAGK